MYIQHVILSLRNIWKLGVHILVYFYDPHYAFNTLEI